jgi:hypothetical protein
MPTFHVRVYEDRFPIGRLIISRANSLGLTRRDFAHRLGYKDISNAHKALADALTTGVVPVHMRKNLARTLELDEEIVKAVFASTARQREDEWRSRLLIQEQEYAAEFQPHLRTETERTVPEPIFIAALGSARLRFAELPPETWETDADGRERLVRQAIRDHYRARHGHVPAFGAILSYTLVTLPGYLVDFGHPFDTEGKPTGLIRAVRRIGSATLGLKRGDPRLSDLLQHTPIAVRDLDTDFDADE